MEQSGIQQSQPLPLKDAMKRTVLQSSNFLGQQADEEQGKEVAIVKAIGAERYLQLCQLRLCGYWYNYIAQKWEIYRPPIMNVIGIGNFMTALQTMAENIYYSNFDEKEIPRLAYFYYQMHMPHFLIYKEEFGLEDRDSNTVESMIFFFALGALKNAKNAGHRNVVRGTLSEQVYMRAFENSQQVQQKKRFGFLRNPFRREG